MKQIAVLKDAAHEWYAQQVAKGYTEIHQASRPLWGDATHDTWDLPCYHGRHAAAIDPKGKNAALYRKQNAESAAARLLFVTEEEAHAAGLKHYQAMRPSVLAAIDLDDYRDHIIIKGLEILGEQN